ncbi:hypothetical protein [Streptomyces sp. NPDC093089]|uniref:hypothetical protein n=1 Tax=Streptomyces sp. NPDC093089 TaxID=3366024 RepID=UPI00380950AD
MTQNPSLSVTSSVAPTPATPTSSVPSVAPTTKATAPEPSLVATSCYPLSNAGICYRAGQICRKVDAGTSGRDAKGRAIHCRNDDSVGQLWGY